MAVVWSHCKTKTVCEPDDAKEEGADAENDEKCGHGGCGHIQPQIRKEGLNSTRRPRTMTMFVHWPIDVGFFTDIVTGNQVVPA